MTAHLAWVAETEQFFAYLRSRGWKFPLIRNGSFLESMHWAHAPRAVNDNRGPA
jgi:hypothetical protein